MQSTNVKLNFDEKLLTLIGSLHHHGFNAKPFYEIDDFSSQLAIVPCSGKTGEGISEIILMLLGLSQKFLKENLKLGKEPKGVILEVTKEKTMQYFDSILYDGTLTLKDEIAIASFDEPILTKIRVLEEIIPLSSKFKPVKDSTAANGIRMQLINSTGILPGMPFTIFKDNLEKIKTEFKKEIGENFQTDEKGIIIKADSLGSLEALITMLKQEKFKIIKAGIGKINKKDIISANTNMKNDPENAIILGFNTSEDNEVDELKAEKSKIKIITNDVIYKLIEELLKFQEEKRNEIKKEKMMGFTNICKLTILHQFIFRNSNPAVFGIKVESGKISKNIQLMNKDGEAVAKVKDLGENQNKIQQATAGQEIAISLPGINFDRQLKDENVLYSDLSENQFKKFKENKDLLTQDEIKTLQEIAQIKRKVKASWGV